MTQIRNRSQYDKEYYIKKHATKQGRIKLMLDRIKTRAKKLDIPFNLTLDHLISIAPDKCPVFNTDFNWNTMNGTPVPTSPSLDKIDPEGGYVIGNVQWVSLLANAMKQNATPHQIKQFAEWALQQPRPLP